MGTNIRKFRFLARKYTIYTLILLIFGISFFGLSSLSSYHSISTDSTNITEISQTEEIKIHSPTLFTEKIIENIEISLILPEITPINTPSPSPTSILINNEIEEIKGDSKLIYDSFMFGWNSYKKYSFGQDFFQPISLLNYSEINVGYFLYESLTTLIFLNETNEINEIINFLLNNQTFLGTSYTSFFISSVFGSLISSYQLTNNSNIKLLLDKIWSLYPFNKDDMYILQNITWMKKRFIIDGTPEIKSSSLGNLQLEYLTLSSLYTNNQIAEKSLQFYQLLYLNSKQNGIVSDLIIGFTGESAIEEYSLISNSQSFYPGLLKAYQITKKSTPTSFKLFSSFIDKLYFDFFKKSKINFKTFLINKLNNSKGPSFHIDTAIFPGLIYESGEISLNQTKKNIAIELMDFFINLIDNGNKLPITEGYIDLDSNDNEIIIINSKFSFCPNLFQSLFIFWKYTKNLKYKNIAWKLFLKFNETCYTENGYVNVLLNENIIKLDEVNPLLYSSTFKYLYLMFNEDINFDFNNWIFNSHGHPIKIWEFEDSELDYNSFQVLPEIFDPDVQFLPE